jgi:hypothetical protein
MKHTLGMLMLLSIIFFGCKKAGTEAITDNQEIYKIEKGVVAFKSFQAYSNFLERSNQKDLDKFIDFAKKSENYTSISEAMPNETATNRLVLGTNAEANKKIQDLLSDDFLSAMINSDGLVQIGDYLFNIDVENDKCYALHTSHLNGTNSSYYYDLILNGNSNNNFVIEFSVDDDIIEFLTNANYPVNKNAFNGSNPVVARLCGETSRPRDEKEADWQFKVRPRSYPQNLPPPYGEPWALLKINGRVVNQKAGVYFALFAKKSLNGTTSNGNPVFSFEQYSWRFKPMCWAERVQLPTWNNPAVEKRYAWQSTRSLSKYEIAIKWSFEYQNGDIVGTTDVLTIKGGY